MAISGPKQPIVNSPAAIASTTNSTAAWWTMNFTPCTMSRQIAWIRFDDGGAAVAGGGRRITTEPMSAAEITKLRTSTA